MFGRITRRAEVKSRDTRVSRLVLLALVLRIWDGRSALNGRNIRYHERNIRFML